ncbi:MULTISPECIES: hypothetical protein [Bacilli]|jgi:hypothetical protein|uniref:Uncharacterized protein n=4 Tax=Caudoviricetes TaxID=2731619 RepID=A1BTZ7_9CAUD|nr:MULTISPECIES: hypothetical protein [Bacilli]YP_006560986.1 helicase loader [Staphylococcus phage Ipla5]YP_950644.1 helicase loader [Staphylococcus phage CNPH82]MBA9940930.1 hypothetical protein [Ralstonia insidiosa]QLF86465.1 hypothetical protein Phi456_00034 [Staphylococcus phage 456]QQV93330.1 hypothetical protein [Staphylococcus phage vB_SepS_456]WEU70053.1 helicase loader [Staphylococcus phage vB_SepS_BE21]DAP15523.1 MAG TPA: replisome organizer protein [Caudoviricetes sp.]
MSMTELEAIEILELINNVYDMKFNKIKYNLWVEQLTQYGDFDRTLHKTKKYVRESRYKPTIAQIIDRKPPEMKSAVIPEEQTDKYRMQHDKEFRERRRQLRKQWQKMKEDWGLDDEY